MWDELNFEWSKGKVLTSVSVSVWRLQHQTQLGHTDKMTLITHTHTAPSEEHVTGSGPHFHSLILGLPKRFSFSLSQTQESSTIWNILENTTFHILYLNNKINIFKLSYKWYTSWHHDWADTDQSHEYEASKQIQWKQINYSHLLASFT